MRRHYHIRNILVVALVILLATSLAFFAIDFKRRQDAAVAELDALSKQIYEQQKFKAQQEEARRQEILSHIPGIVCWGDSLTKGEGGKGVSFPSVLKDHLDKNDYPYPVVNEGVGGEGSIYIMNRALKDAYSDYIPIVFMGQNGGWNDDPQTLIQQQQTIIDASGLNKDRYLILGLTSGSKESRADLETAMSAMWGKQYLNLREYLCSMYILTKFGMTVTSNDKEQIAQGIVPDCARSDEVNLNSSAYKAVGDLVFNKLAEFDFIEK